MLMGKLQQNINSWYYKEHILSILYEIRPDKRENADEAGRQCTNHNDGGLRQKLVIQVHEHVDHCTVSEERDSWYKQLSLHMFYGQHKQ